MATILEAGPKNKKMEEWLQKSPQEQEKIAEENEWRWFFEFYEAGDIIRSHYEKADKSDRVKDKYHGCYDGYYKEHKKGESYVHLGLDGCFHRTEKPTSTWTEYHPCSNKKCPYYDPKGHKDRGGNCGYFGDNVVIGYDCFNGLFATIQQWIDVCGLEELDQLQQHYNIHEDIIGWFKEGDEYFKNKESDKVLYLNKEAVDEITELLNEVKKVVEFVGNLGITYHSDAWNAVNPLGYDYENILSWDRRHFEHIDMTGIEKFNFGGSVCIAEYEWKGKYICGPKALHQAKVDTVKQYMQEVVDNFHGTYFKVSNVTDEPIYDNCGWECFVEFAVIPIKSKCFDNTDLNKFAQQIIDEAPDSIDSSWIDYNIKNPDDNKKYYAMVGFLSSRLVDHEDAEYQNEYGLNGMYIRHASNLIKEMENVAEEIRIKYNDKNIKVSIGDLNEGCQFGMAIYVWIPYQTQHKEIPKDLYYY